jgi:hypothetical protein
MWLKLSVGVPSICVRSFQLMFPHGRCFEIQRKQWLQCFTNGIEIRSCFGKTWYMNEWSANDPPTCTTHATHTIPKACKLLCITLLYKGSAPSFQRIHHSHTLVMWLCIWNNSVGWYWIFIKTFWFQNFMRYFIINNEPWVPIFFGKKTFTISKPTILIMSRT